MDGRLPPKIFMPKKQNRKVGKKPEKGNHFSRCHFASIYDDGGVEKCSECREKCVELSDAEREYLQREKRAVATSGNADAWENKKIDKNGRIISNPRARGEYHQFMLWYILPRSLRVPKTQVELATKLKVNDRTLYTWSHTEAFQEEASKLAKVEQMNNLGDVLRALYLGCIEKRSAPEIRLFLESIAGFIPKESGSAQNITTVIQLNADKLYRIAQRISKEKPKNEGEDTC